MSDLPRYLNHVPRTTLLIVKMEAAISDMTVIANYLDKGAYAADDIESLAVKVENLSASLSELRMGMEISAEARSISDSDYEDMVDEVEDDDD